MGAVAVALGLLLGASGPVALGALSTFQIAQLALMGVKLAPKAIIAEKQLLEFIQSPQFRVMLAANGDAAIRWQDKQQEF